eukprot:11315472-Heterocapsa_arctica.AAC.1
MTEDQVAPARPAVWQQRALDDAPPPPPVPAGGFPAQIAVPPPPMRPSLPAVPALATGEVRRWGPAVTAADAAATAVDVAAGRVVRAGL